MRVISKYTGKNYSFQVFEDDNGCHINMGHGGKHFKDESSAIEWAEGYIYAVSRYDFSFSVPDDFGYIKQNIIDEAKVSEISHSGLIIKALNYYFKNSYKTESRLSITPDSPTNQRRFNKSKI